MVVVNDMIVVGDMVVVGAKAVVGAMVVVGAIVVAGTMPVVEMSPLPISSVRSSSLVVVVVGSDGAVSGSTVVNANAVSVDVENVLAVFG